MAQWQNEQHGLRERSYQKKDRDSNLVAGDVSELVDGDEPVEVGPEDDAVTVAGGFQDPDLRKNQTRLSGQFSVRNLRFVSDTFLHLNATNHSMVPQYYAEKHFHD